MFDLTNIDHIPISKKKPNYKPSLEFIEYLQKYDRGFVSSINYKDLMRMEDAFPVKDKNGEDTFWYKAIYPQQDMQELNQHLKLIYSLLKSGGNYSVHEHLMIDSIEYCAFGNSNPFRIKIVNTYNDVTDYFYVKKADASRIYGLELEHILSPFRINFFSNRDTLVEEHIVGIPGDVFLKKYLHQFDFNKKRLAKEFVKFNERSFVRLLGDMRSYNFVIDMTYDFEDIQFRVRPIDFDQQSYEGNFKLYLPQFFKENAEFVKLVIDNLNEDVIKQYKEEERSVMKRRVLSSKNRLLDLYNSLGSNEISTIEKTNELKEGLADYLQEKNFMECITMADIVRQSLRLLSL